MPHEFETQLKEELWGCFKHIGIPFETLNKMPIQDRKFYIKKHNMEQAEYVDIQERNKRGSGSSVMGDSINTFAGLEQSNLKNR